MDNNDDQNIQPKVSQVTITTQHAFEDFLSINKVIDIDLNIEKIIIWSKDRKSTQDGYFLIFPPSAPKFWHHHPQHIRYNFLNFSK